MLAAVSAAAAAATVKGEGWQRGSGGGGGDDDDGGGGGDDDGNGGGFGGGGVRGSNVWRGAGGICAGSGVGRGGWGVPTAVASPARYADRQPTAATARQPHRRVSPTSACRNYPATYPPQRGHPCPAGSTAGGGRSPLAHHARRCCRVSRARGTCGACGVRMGVRRTVRACRAAHSTGARWQST